MGDYYLNINKNKVNVIFDCGGNVYLEFAQKIYTLEVTNGDGNNCGLVCEEYLPTQESNVDDIYQETHNNIGLPKYGRIKLRTDKSSLSGKINNEENKMNLDKHYDDMEDNDNEDLEYDKYKYENIEYDRYDDDVDELDEYNDVEYAVFSSVDKGIKIKVMNLDDTIAQYDVLLYDKNNNICFESSLHGSNPAYRLKIYQNGKISFRAIGSNEVYYFVAEDMERLVLHKV